MCNFQGSILPEMTKKRHIIVIRKHRENAKLFAVVPVSTTKPPVIHPYHYLFDRESSLYYFDHPSCWVKCDMVSVVSIDRLDYVPEVSDRIKVLELPDEILTILKQKVMLGLGFSPHS